MNERIINDWVPEVSSLLRTLEKHGFTLLRGNNGEDDFKYSADKRAEFIENLIACDEASLRVEKDGHGFGLFLVLGNDPGELVSDYSAKTDELLALLDAPTREHSERWEGRAQPKKTINS